MNHGRNIEISELRFVLDRLVALHGNLVEVLRVEFAHMTDLDVKSLGEATNAKEVILSEIWNLEHLRIQACEKVATSLGLDAQNATLLTIANALPEAQDGAYLRQVRTALGLLVDKAKTLNTQNMDFAAASLGHIDEMKRNVLGISNQASQENYSQSGSMQPLPEQGGRLLSTEA